MSYASVMARKNELMIKSVGIDYQQFARGPLAFDYELMMSQAAYSLHEIRHIQAETAVGNTPLIELKNVTTLARTLSDKGKGARIFIKDEACNPSGSFKARRASVSVCHAQRRCYPGVITATSGNYGAAVASQAAMRGLRCIVVQEVFDSRGIGQPEILEKGRACEALGAEVIQVSVGPELFYVFLTLLEETGFFNASLYTPFSVVGIETLGYEVAEQTQRLTGKFPDAVVVTHAGGGNVTGTARGLVKSGSTKTKVVGASVDLAGLHMASDQDFNRKSFTTGHTGFGVPFATFPDRSDVPRNAARALRYLDRWVTVSQGEVFYVTEMLAQLEGLERGPAGNTSLAAAFSLAQEMSDDEVIVVQETEYTGAGKLPSAQLTFAKENGVEVRRGNPTENQPGVNIVIPESPSQIKARDLDLSKIRASYIRNAVNSPTLTEMGPVEIEFLVQETKSNPRFVVETLLTLNVPTKQNSLHSFS
jgi:2-amino-4-ketopentanoate thiolase beta subunit